MLIIYLFYCIHFTLYVEALTSHLATRGRNVLPIRYAHQNSLQPQSSPSDTGTLTPTITERILALTQKEDIVIVIDVENVRGKTSFELDHCDLLDRLVIWTSLRHNALGRTLAVVDHGSKSSAHLLHDGYKNTNKAALCVSFAGPEDKADDVIARDVRWLLTSSTTQHIVVITADQELAWRCRFACRSSDFTKFNSVLRKFVSDGNDYARGGARGIQRGKGGKNKKSRAERKKSVQLHQEAEDDDEEIDKDIELSLNQTNNVVEDTTDLAPTPIIEIISPQRFLEDLEEALREWLLEQSTLSDATTAKEIVIDEIPIPSPITSMQKLFQLCGEILFNESLLRKKCSLNNRHMLTDELRVKKAEWKELLLSLRESSVDMGGSLSSSLAWSLSSLTSLQDKADEDESLQRASIPSSSSIPASLWEDLTLDEKERLLIRWGKRRGRQGTKREKTEDRIVLAERLRRQLELVETPKCKDEASLAQLYGDYINSAQDIMK